MKKTATILALAGLSMAAPEHIHGSFRNRKVPEHRQLIDPYVPHKLLNQETLNADDELLLIYKPQHDIDPGMVMRPPRGYDIDPGMIKRPAYPYNNIDQGIFVKPRTTPQVMYADDELIAYIPKEQDKGALRQHKDDELFKGVDAGMVIKPKRGDIDPKMVIKPKRGDIDPKIILNPKKDVIYADDEMFYANDDELIAYLPKEQDKGALRQHKDDEFMVYLPKELDKGALRQHRDDEFMVYLPKELDKGALRQHRDDEFIAYIPKEQDKGALRQHKDDELFKGVDAGMIIKPKRGDIDPKIILNPKKDIIYADDEMFYANDDELIAYIPKEQDKGALRQHKDDEFMVYLPKELDKGALRQHRDDEFIAYIPKEQDKGALRQHKDDELFKGVDAGMVIKPKRGDIDPGMIIKPKRGNIDPKIILNPKKDVIYADDELVVLSELLSDN